MEGIKKLGIEYKAEIILSLEETRVMVEVDFVGVGIVTIVFNTEDLACSRLPVSDLIRSKFNNQIAKHYRKVGESK